MKQVPWLDVILLRHSVSPWAEVQWQKHYTHERQFHTQNKCVSQNGQSTSFSMMEVVYAAHM